MRTDSFKKWFGDWENDPQNASKVIDENGEPLVMYHGTTWEPTLDNGTFSTSKVGKNFSEDYDYNFYFTNKTGAEGYGHAIPVFLNVRNPELLVPMDVSDENLANDPASVHEELVESHDGGNDEHLPNSAKFGEADGAIHKLPYNTNADLAKYNKSMKDWWDKNRIEMDELKAKRDAIDNDTYQKATAILTEAYKAKVEQSLEGVENDMAKGLRKFMLDNAHMGVEVNEMYYNNTYKDKSYITDQQKKAIADIIAKGAKKEDKYVDKIDKLYATQPSDNLPMYYSKYIMVLCDQPNQIKHAENNTRFSSDENIFK